MKEIMDFLSAALPWLCMGLLLAVFFARSESRKKRKADKKDYGTEGIALGMCFGTAIGTSLGYNSGVGMMLGMLVGLMLGSRIEKKDDGNEK